MITDISRQITPALLEQEGTVLLESQSQGMDDHTSWLFTEPVDVIQCHRADQVSDALSMAQELVDGGRVLAGFLGYEAGAALRPHQVHPADDDFPLVWLGVYSRAGRIRGPLALPWPPSGVRNIEAVPHIHRQRFTEDVGTILKYIRDGETYQVNYTCRLRFKTALTPLEMYLFLRRRQPVPYGALLNCGSFSVVSQSPELFLRRDGQLLFTRPMKGTAPRGETPDEDRWMASWLGSDPKNRAENLMIADLMRNDLGKIARTGSVEVFDAFRVERYRTVHQMTTGVRCTLPPDTGSMEILKATFPPGSITGAPKVRTMQIISQLEDASRKVYTGAIGAFFPSGDTLASVAIRTVIMNRDGSCELGVGSGIVNDSDPDQEYEETVLKAAFLGGPGDPDPELLETMLLDTGGVIVSLDEHLARLERSAGCLGYPLDMDRLRRRLSLWLEPVGAGPYVVRLRLNHLGETALELLPAPEPCGGSIKVQLSRWTTDAADALLRHKTTRRKLYDMEHRRAAAQGFTDVLFANKAGNLTEGAVSNLFVKTRSGWLTPPVSDGLLPGIWRASFSAAVGAKEVCVGPAILGSARRVVMGNSVRGAMEVGEVRSHQGELLFKGRARA